ncbi:MAG: hypothetical protein RR248_04935 [Clostridia bacterium]
MKKLISILLVTVMLVSGLSIFSACGEAEKDFKMMKVDTNPSVEFMLDSKNKVVSVTGLNNDGEIIVVGEAFIGKTAEEAIQLYMSIATDTGYIVKGNVEASSNKVTVTINGVGAEELYNKINAKVTKFFADNNIKGAIEQSVAYTKEQLAVMAQQIDQTITEAKANAMTLEELLALIATSRKETAELISQAMRDAYYTAKNYEVSFSQKQQTKELINGLGNAYTVVVENYSKLLDSYQKGIEQIEKAKYDYFVNPESDYQKAIYSLIEKKADLIAQKNVVAQLEEGLAKEIAKGELMVKEKAYDFAKQTLEGILTVINATFDGVIATLKSIETQLVAFEKTFPAEITAELTAKTAEIEKAINNTKTHFFDKFETEFTKQITAIETRLAEIKATMIANNKAK